MYTAWIQGREVSVGNGTTEQVVVGLLSRGPGQRGGTQLPQDWRGCPSRSLFTSKRDVNPKGAWGWQTDVIKLRR